MGDKKTRKGLDTLRNDIQELTEVVADLKEKLATQHALSSAENHVSSATVSSAVRELEAHAREADENGSVSAYGYFESSGDQDEQHVYRWSMEERSAQEILSGPVSQYAHSLAAIGHPQRLNILLMLLSEPATANDVVSQLSLGTTGAAYHHLNVLQAAGFVEQQHRGIFTIVLDKIPALLTILASLSDGMAIEILDHLPEDEEDEMDAEAEIVDEDESGDILEPLMDPDDDREEQTGPAA